MKPQHKQLPRPVLGCACVLAIDHTVFSKTDGSAHLYSGKINGTPHLAEEKGQTRIVAHGGAQHGDRAFGS